MPGSFGKRFTRFPAFSVPFIRDGLKIYNHLPAEELNELLNRSEFIVARSGYSTIMDLVNLKRNAILVPTPGQPEQEYLGRYMHENKWMFSVPQKKFNIENVLSEFKKAELVTPEIAKIFVAEYDTGIL